jgi:outer membrane protein assembly factor BamD (BamD/ComL family)
VSTKNQEKLQEYYQVGKKALENGQYRLSIEKLESAKELVNFNSKLGADVQILLATAYQAAGKKQEAIALCQELTTHPNLLTRQKAKDVLYIIQAPELQRPPEWMSKIPDLSNSDASKSQYVTTKRKTTKKQRDLINEPIDLSQVNTEDNQFIWFALILATLTIGGIIWLK